MKTSEQYLSFVENRIKSLEAKLYNPSIANLEREFIEKKIRYLKKLTNLPLLLTINNLSDEELQVIQNKYGYSKDCAKTFLISLFELEPLAKFIEQPKTVTLGYMKEAIINDFDTMNSLIKLQSRNLEYENRKKTLWGPSSNEHITYIQLYNEEKNMALQKQKLETAMEEAKQNYDYETLKELHTYQTNRQKPLSLDFILKHKNKVEINPEAKKLAARLTRKGILGKIDKFLPFRKRREQQYLDAVLNSYKNNKKFSTLGIVNQDITTMDEKQIISLMKQIQSQITYQLNKIAYTKNEIQKAKKLILNQIKKYEILQEQDKEKFMAILATKINFLPKMFKEQIWNEPDFKESLMRVACYQEEKMLIEQLSNSVQNKTDALLEISSEKTNTFVKRVAA